ncbi:MULTISPECIES: type IV secretory system conjugative DNA transfer family protein [Cyanophyceae]|uniref:Type IV secretion system DNA-binding domain-containing protein n=1 Tax=Leptolyngbya subtilissima DQ-A4 TaxID=2933933 RepID=A0ABV0KAV0_9CYAN|nr:type IV secretion system DNA-binding domain-containing protein [Nodosilinea sp. FACHB-141]MBD2115180.1 type IV secretion system DNA-binding domain-containing protein [Nodosilinea sp. FACHB-141]
MHGDFFAETPSDVARRIIRAERLGDSTLQRPTHHYQDAYEMLNGPPISFAGHKVGLDELGHVAVVGASGAGKNFTMGPTARTLIEAVRADPSRRLLILETKEDFLKAVRAGGVLYELVTFTYKDGKTWNIARDFASPQLIAQLGYVLFPEMEGNNAFFRNAGRALFVASVISIHQVTEGVWGMDDLVNVALADPVILKRILRQSEPGQWVLNTLFAGKDGEEHLNKVRTEVMSRVWLYLMTPAAKYQHSESGISLVDFWKGHTEASILVVKINPEKYDVERPIAQAIISRSLDIIMASPESDKKDKIVVADDFNFYGPIPKFREASELIRGRGGLLFILFQSIEGLRAKDSYDDRAEAVLANFSWKIMLRASSPETARWCASQFGRDVVRETDVGVSFDKRGTSGKEENRRSVENIVHERTFLNLPLPSKAHGITLYLKTPKWGEELEKHLPWDQVVKRHPPRTKKVILRPLPPDQELPSLWSNARSDWLITGERPSEDEPKPTNRPKNQGVMDNFEIFESELRGCVYDEVLNVIKDMAVYLEIPDDNTAD